MQDPYARNEIHFEFILNGKSYRHSFKLSPLTVRDLTQSVELSDEPLSLMLASRSLYGGRGSAITERAQKLEDRRAFAKSIAREMVHSLMKVFDSYDKRDGYSTRPDQNG